MANPKDCTILVVDDTKANIDLLVELLGSSYEVSVALDGKMALDLVESDKPDLVLLDIMMPEMDGYQVLERMKRDEALRNIPVIMISAIDEMKSVVRCIQNGADDYLVKPFDATLLKARIGACLERKHYHDLESEILEKTLSGSVRVLMEILSTVNPVAFSLTSNVRQCVRLMTKTLKLDKAWQFELAALLSQIGCVTIPPDAMEKYFKGRPLSESEKEMFANQSSVGCELLEKIPRLEAIAKMIRDQQKPFSQYPAKEQPRRDEVEIGSQMLKVAVDYSVSAQKGTPPKEILEKFRKSPTAYDPLLVDCLGSLDREKDKKKTGLISIEGLKNGMVIGENVLGKDKQLIASAGMEVTPAIRTRLMNFFRSGLIENQIPVILEQPNFGKVTN